MIITSIQDMGTPQERIRGLTGDAKWASDEEIQKRSIDELGALGPASVASLEEIMAVTSREEIRKHCMEAIKGIERKGKDSAPKRARKNNNGKPAKK